jgi:hypothetical protein
MTLRIAKPTAALCPLRYTRRLAFDGRCIRLPRREFCAIPATNPPKQRKPLSTTICSSDGEWFAAGEAAKFFRCVQRRRN